MRGGTNGRMRRIAAIFIILSIIQMAGTYGWFTSGVPLIGVADAKNDGGNGNSGGGGGNSGGGNAGGNSGGGGGNSGGGNAGGGQGGSSGHAGVPGAAIVNTGGQHTLEIDLPKAKSAGEKISVQGNTIHFEHDTHTITVTTKSAPKEEQGQLRGEIESITLQSTPVNAKFSGKGTVSASFGADLNELPAPGATVTASLIEKPDDQSRAAFDRAAEENGVAVDTIAYALMVDKSGLEDGSEIGQATVTMTVSPLWVLSHGGFSGIHIARFAEDGSSELLASSFNGIDADSNMVFTGTSPRGLSIFALISIKAPAQAVVPQPATTPSGRADASASMIFIPPILLFAAFILIRKT